MFWWRRKAEEERRHQALLDLIREEQELNHILTCVCREQVKLIERLAGGKQTYPQTIGMKITTARFQPRVA